MQVFWYLGLSLKVRTYIMKKLVFLVLILLGFSSFTTYHKFYVSVTEVEFNEKAQSLQIISRVFTDDLENVLRKRYKDDLRLGKNLESLQAPLYLKKYLEQKLQIWVDDKIVQINYLGREYDNDLTILYIEVENVPEFDRIKLENTVLMDLFQEQKNLMHVEHKGKIKSLVLTKEKEKGVLSF